MTPGSLELNKYAIAIDISNSLDSNNRSSQEPFGGGSLESALSLVSGSFISFFDLPVFSVSFGFCPSKSVSPFCIIDFSLKGLLFIGIATINPQSKFFQTAGLKSQNFSCNVDNQRKATWSSKPVLSQPASKFKVLFSTAILSLSLFVCSNQQPKSSSYLIKSNKQALIVMIF